METETADVLGGLTWLELRPCESVLAQPGQWVVTVDHDVNGVPWEVAVWQAAGQRVGLVPTRSHFFFESEAEATAFARTPKL